MISPDQLCQSDVRTRQAKMMPGLRFGGLGTFFTGDFLQLPPIDKGSLARVIDDDGILEETDAEGCAPQVQEPVLEKNLSRGGLVRVTSFGVRSEICSRCQ